VLAISSASRVNGIAAPTLRESGVALDLANWRAIVAPPGLSDVEEETLTARIATLAASPQWRSTLEQNGWADQFLAGPPLRQFLLAEQARIEDVLRRLAANNSRAPSALAVTLTPSTLPNAVALIFLGTLVLTAAQTSRPSRAFDRQGAGMAGTIVAALLILPLTFVTAGFVASSTLTFALAATALRAQPFHIRTIAVDLLVGAAFSITLFLLFTRGLGVMLPGFP
jgi:hypothetical protein